MNRYTPANPPKKGNARSIWSAIESVGFQIIELHYNPNLWGRGKVQGYGTWAVTMQHDREGKWAGVDKRGVYLETMEAPYNRVYLGIKQEG